MILTLPGKLPAPLPVGWEAVSACSWGQHAARSGTVWSGHACGISWARMAAAAPWAPCSSAESSCLHLLARMSPLPRGVFAEDSEEHIRPSVEKGE